MNNKISNQFLKQLISEISSNANKGRISVDWGIVNEAKKKKRVKEADEKTTDKPADAGKKPTDAGTDLPPLGGPDETPKDAPAKDNSASKPAEPKKDAAPDAGAASAAPENETDKAKEDAAKAKAELAQATAEKAQAEEKIKTQSYVSLGSDSGIDFLLRKMLDHAVNTNTTDDLAKDMIEKLKINTDNVDDFSQKMNTHMTIPGMPTLLDTIKRLATKSSEPAEEPKS